MAAIVAAPGRGGASWTRPRSFADGWRGRLAGRTVASMPDALLDRDAELAALAASSREVRAGTGRVIVVEGAGRDRQVEPARRGRARAPRRTGSPCCERAAARSSSDAAWGSPASCSRRCVRARRGASWRSARPRSRGGRSTPTPPSRPSPGDAMHAAAHGLDLAGHATWRTRAPTLLVVDDVHWADAPSLRWLAQLARRLDGLRARPPVRGPRRRAGGRSPTCSPSCSPPRRSRRCVRAPLGPAAAEALVRERLPARRAELRARLPRRHRPATRSCSAPCSRTSPPRASRRPTEVAARLSAFGPEQVARSVERQLARLPDRRRRARARVRRARPRAPLRHAARARRARPGDAARGWPTRLRAVGLLAGDRDRAGARAPARRERARREPATRGALALARPGGAAARARARRPRNGRAAPAAHRPGRRARDRGGAARGRRPRRARGAPESAAAFLRRALAEPPPDRAGEAAVRAGLGLALAATLHPDAPAPARRSRRLAATPAQRGEFALRGARALGAGRSLRPTRSTSAGAALDRVRRHRRPTRSRGWMPS